MKTRYLRLIKKQRGFTLIELLAVILILGIIALIAIPTVSSVVEQSRKGANENTGNQMVVSAEQYYKMCELRDGKDINGNECSSDLAHSSLNKDDMAKVLGIKGDIPNKEELIVYKKSDNGIIALVYKKDSYLCSNQIDENEKVVYRETGIENPKGVKCSRVEYKNDGTIVSKDDNNPIEVGGNKTDGGKNYLWNSGYTDDMIESLKNGQVYIEELGLQKYYQTGDYVKKIYTVSFVNYDTVPENAVVSWDLSEKQDNSIKGWLTYVEDSTAFYDLYIGSKSDIYANPNSALLFNYMTEVRSYDFTNFHTDDVVNAFGLFMGNFELNNLDISSLNFSNVQNMSYMFCSLGYLTPSMVYIRGLNRFDMSNVNNTEYMFAYAGHNSEEGVDFGDLSNWNTSKVTNMEAMFYMSGSSGKSIVLSGLDKWDISNVKNLARMFCGFGYNATNINLGNLGNWNTSQVTRMDELFDGVGYNANSVYIGDLSNWNTSKLENVAYMFYGFAYSVKEINIGDIGKWDMSNVNNLNHFFSYFGYNVTKFPTLDLSKWDISKVSDMGYAFYKVGYSTTSAISIGDIGNWNVSNVNNFDAMFYCFGFSSTAVSIGDISSWDVSKGEKYSSFMSSFGYNSRTLNIGNLNNWNVSNAKNMTGMFNAIGRNSKSVNIGDISNWDVSGVTDMSGMFKAAMRFATSLDIGDISKWNTQSVTNMSEMFNMFGESSTYSLDLSGWNVDNVLKHDKFNASVTSKVTPPIWKK